MAKFNLGLLKNIGFKVASDKKEEYFVLSDVDLLPSVQILSDYLRYPDKPIHLGNFGTRYNTKRKNNPDFLGGVISFNRDDYLKCNGYPNNFWGWGGEDNALNMRLKKNSTSGKTKLSCD